MSEAGDAGRQSGPSSADPWSPQAGTTLVEALVVVTITAMIGAILFPNLRQGVAGAAFGQAVSGIRADLRIARAQALSTGEPVTVEVAPGGQSYGWTPGPQRGLIAGMALSPSETPIRFFPDGSSSGGELSLSNGRLLARFDVDAGTGVLRISS